MTVSRLNPTILAMNDELRTLIATNDSACIHRLLLG